jgi:hypothetical protein
VIAERRLHGQRTFVLQQAGGQPQLLYESVEAARDAATAFAQEQAVDVWLLQEHRILPVTQFRPTAGPGAGAFWPIAGDQE